ncbi:hypothetical protein Tco_0847265 [Tanacetum coccineum]
MAVLESCPKHNMIAYLEKTDGNTEFHEITASMRSSIPPCRQGGDNLSAGRTDNSKVIRTAIFDAIKLIEVSGGNQGGQSSSDRSLSGNEGGMTLQSVYDLCISLCTQVTNQAKQIKHLKAQIKKLKKKAKPVITHHKAWMKSVSMKQRLAGKKSLKKQWMQKESVSKQGRKPAKAEPTVHKDPTFDELDDEQWTISRLRMLKMWEVNLIPDKPDGEGTDKPKVSTDKEEVSTDRPDEGTVDQNEGRSATQTALTTTTPTIFGDDETISKVLIIMRTNKEKLKEKEKGVELKDVEETERPRPTSAISLLTLKPLPKIYPKDKGKKMIKEEDESDTDSKIY